MSKTFPVPPLSPVCPRAAILVVLAFLLALPAFAQRPARLSITVQNAEGEPLEGVRVSAVNEEEKVDEERVTDDEGEARFALRKAGAYELRLQKEGYEPGATRIDLDPGAVEYLTLALRPAGATPTPTAEESPGEAPPPEATLTPAEERFNEGVELLQAEKLDEAEAKFLEALELDSNLAVAHSALAAIYLERDDLDAALESATIFATAVPENPRGHSLLYEIHQRRGDEASAEAAFAKLSELQSGDDAAALLYNEAAAAVRVGDLERGRERLEKALSTSPDLAPALRLLAIVHITGDRPTEAVAAADRYLAFVPDDTKILKLRWDALVRLGEEEKAAAAYEALVAADPSALADDLFEEGRKAFEAGDLDTAQDRLEKAVEIDPDLAQAWYVLGLCRVNAGDNAAAREALEKFVALAPGDPQAETAREMMRFLE